MKALKANKEYTITEQEQERYIAEGYDIADNEGNIIAYGKGKTVPYEKYKEVLEKSEKIIINNSTQADT